MENEQKKSPQERETLRNIIAQWNANRLDLFELSEPNENLEFHGVMRFYFQDAGQKVATKCIRVSSTATASHAIETLIEKFRPDMRMLSIPEYALYEIHENGEDRKLEEHEKPLLVQLNWHKDDRDGRFLLRRMNEKSFITHQSLDDGTHFKRKLSKREKKEKKKREKLQKPKVVVNEEEQDKDGIAEKLYTEMPETSFTRSISNPEAVMRRRRQQKLEKKLQQFRSTDGGPDTGGTLKIYGESLCKDVPYKTLLLSIKDNATFVVKEMLDKYGLDKEEPSSFCLVQVLLTGDRENKDPAYASSGQKEFILDDEDCPLAILMNHHSANGHIMFHIRRRPGDSQPRKRKKKPKSSIGDLDGAFPYGDIPEKLPFLLELNPDGSDITSGSPKKYTLHLNVTEVGSERGTSPSGQCLQLFGPNVQPRHCVIAHTEGIVTVTPCSRDAESYVNGQRIYETTILQPGMVVRFGRIHCFRFYNLGGDEKRLGPDNGIRHPHEMSYDRHSVKDDSSLHHSFDADGNADSMSNSKDYRRLEPVNKNNSVTRRGPDPILPAVLELWEDNEEAFLSAIILNLDTASVQFKLAPTYTLYMAARFQASTHFHPEITPNERAHRLTASLSKVATRIQTVIQERYLDAGSLAFWMANSSELLYFLKQDRHLSPFCVDAQEILAECVQVAFRNLAHCLQDDLLNAMPKFLEDRDDLGEEEGTSGHVLGVLLSTMALLRRCRVNAALTIQLFSQLFHFINMWLFNKIVCEPRAIYAARLWGVRLKCRLSRIEMWAEKQGLELAADCHLSRILQAAHLLQAPKSSPDDLAAISSMCFKLNSLQLRALLERYQPAHDEPHIPHVLIEKAVKVAENTADEMARSDGRDVRLEENPDLQLPFILPEDGYSCDIVRGVPAGLQEFITPYQCDGLCRMAIQPSSIGYWTIYMSDHDTSRATMAPRSPSVMSYQVDKDPSRISRNSPEPEIATIKLHKSNNGMGLSIVAARGIGQDKLGIYIKSVVKGGAADADGRLQAGDQLLKVDGQSLVGISQEKAAEFMTRTGSIVILEVAKQGAMFHGLATLLSQPSPVIHRSGPGYSAMRRMSERDIHGKVLKEQMMNNSVDAPPSIMPRMQSSKSVPALNSGNAAPQEPIWNSSNVNHSSFNESYELGQPTSTELPGVLKNKPPPPNININNSSMRPENFQNHSNQVPIPNPKMMNGRPLSHPAFPQDEERHYQNITMYLQGGNQQAQSQAFSPNQEPQSPTAKAAFGQPTEERMSQRFKTSQSALNRPEMQHPLSSLPQRPVSALLSQWERDHLPSSANHQAHLSPNRSQDDSSLRNQPLHGQMPNNKYFSKSNVYSKENPEPVRNPNLVGRGVSSQDLNMNPERVRHELENWKSERDLIRQEAKMEEMREEVKRRETRERKIQETQQMQQQRLAAPYSASTSSLHPGPNSHLVHNASRVPPPTQPKPRFPISAGNPQGPAPSNRPYSQQDIPPDRPPLPPEELIGHRLDSSPQPPPPPPSSTHPLYQHKQQQQLQSNVARGQRPPEMLPSRSVDHFDRLQQSLNYEIQNSHLIQSRSYPNDLGQSTLSPSPWDREERERERVRRLDEARRLRDQEIEEMENLGPQRTPKEEERLRTLRLEQEFQRRAEELKNEEDDENEDDDDSLDRRGLLRLMQEDLERNRLKRLERENERVQYQQKQQSPPQQQPPPSHPAMAPDTQRPERRLQFVEPDKNWRNAPPGVQHVPNPPHQSSIPHHPAAPMGQSYHPPTQNPHMQQQQHFVQQQQPMHHPNQNNNSEEWLKRQQEVKEQRQRLQYVEQQQQQQQQMSRVITQDRISRLEEVNQIREQKREQERAAVRELQVAREAEERLLREAQLRQEADMRRERTQPQQQSYQPQQQQNYQPQQPNYQQQQPQHSQGKTYSHYEAYTPPSVYLNNQVIQDTNNNRNAGGGGGGGFRPQNHVKYPAGEYEARNHHNSQQPQPVSNGGHSVSAEPPERKDSYEKVAMHYGEVGGGGYYEAVPSPQAKENAPPPPKRVSFFDSKEEESSANGSQLLSTPTNSQQTTTFTVGSTPGVIGAQEVYRDPRQRIEASRNPVANTSRGPGPEQLSFREKMKKFALETGEDMTPKDKVKISKAQREIETNLNGP